MNGGILHKGYLKSYNTVILVFVSLFFVTSCMPDNLKRVEMESFPVCKKLIAERIPLEQVLSPGYLLNKHDVLFATGEKGDTLLYRYQLPDLSYIDRFGIKGQGEDDFQLFPMFAKSQSEDVYIWGYTPLTIKRFSLDNDGRLVLKRKYQLASYESFNEMHVAMDSILIYSAIPSEFAIKKVDLNTGALLGKIPIETDRHKDSFFYSNRGYVAANDSFVVYTYVYKKQIDIYSIADLSLSKSLAGIYQEQKIDVGNFESNINYYLDVVAGKDYFYALCKGVADDVSLEVFDYAGHSIACYAFDIFPHLFAVDEENGCIYGYNYELEDCFLRYCL